MRMIKFFRTIRRNLMETGKTGLPEQRVRAGRYLKYAIGEIILVVIGILIALSINNWNEVRKLKIQEVALLNYTLENIESDSTIVSNVLGSLDTIIKMHEQLVAVVNNEIKFEDVKNLSLIRMSFPNKVVTKKKQSRFTKGNSRYGA